MKKSIAFLMMMMLGVSAPSLAQQAVEEETNYIEHMIRRGEDFASIAQKYGITEQQLRDANPKYKNAYAGLKLRVPQQQTTTQAPAPQPSQPQQVPQIIQSSQLNNTTQTEQVVNTQQAVVNNSIIEKTKLIPAGQSYYYEGEKDKNGLPNGKGTMYFEATYYNVAYLEVLDGEFKKGSPVKGKSFRYYKNNGKLIMKFEGIFFPKWKGIPRNLSDLKVKGNILFYKYEEREKLRDWDYSIEWGLMEGNTIKKGYYIDLKKRKMGEIVYGRKQWANSDAFTPEGQKLFDEFYCAKGSAWIFDRKPIIKYGKVYNREDNFIKLNDIRWTGTENNGLIDGKGEGFATIIDGKESVNYRFNGTFENGAPKNVVIIREYFYNAERWIDQIEETSTIQVTTGESNNDRREFSVKPLMLNRGRNLSYSGYVDKDFKFLDDYAALEIERLKEQEGNFLLGLGQAVSAGMKVAAVVGALTSDSGSSSSSTSSYNSKSKTESSSKKEVVDTNQLVEDLSLPSYQFDGDWGKESLLPSDKTNKDGENQSRRIKFDDAPSGKISRVIGNKGFWSSNKCRYETLEDVIIAEYAYKKYNKVREKGRMHGVLY